MARKSKLAWVESSGNLYTDMGYSEPVARRLQFRSYLMAALVKFIQSENLTQVEAAKRLQTSPTQINNLLQCKCELFSIDSLMDLLERAGFRCLRTYGRGCRRFH